MKKALIVGIDYYADISSLYGRVKNANAVKQALERHADGSINFFHSPTLQHRPQAIRLSQ